MFLRNRLVVYWAYNTDPYTYIACTISFLVCHGNAPVLTWWKYRWWEREREKSWTINGRCQGWWTGDVRDDEREKSWTMNGRCQGWWMGESWMMNGRSHGRWAGEVMDDERESQGWWTGEVMDDEQEKSWMMNGRVRDDKHAHNMIPSTFWISVSVRWSDVYLSMANHYTNMGGYLPWQFIHYVIARVLSVRLELG